MKIIEIKALDNGAHRNQEGVFFKIPPEGWAVIPDDMETPNFPFGEIVTTEETVTEVETVDGEEVEKVIGTRQVVTKWIAGTIPEEEPEAEEPETPVSKVDQLIETLYKAGKLTEEEYNEIVRSSTDE